MFNIPAGAVYRYYESRRRQFIDSHQSREEKAAANQKNSTKRRSQKKVIEFFSAHIMGYLHIHNVFHLSALSETTNSSEA